MLLHCKAAEYCDLDTLKLLIKPGAQVTKQIIKHAAKNEESEPLWYLLDSAQDDIKYQCKGAALRQGILDGNLDLIEKLAASGAELHDSELWLGSGIQAIVKRGNLQVLRLLLDRYQNSLRDSLGSALTTAILCDQNEAMEMLLTAGADIDGEKYSGVSPISAAIGLENSNLIRRLLAVGAAVNQTQTIQMFEDQRVPVDTTVLPAIVSWGDYFLIQDIIKAGADVNAPGYSTGETALVVAVNRGDKRIVELLIDSGASVSAVAAIVFGPTALEVASRNNDLSMVQFLLGLGADPDEWSLVESVSGSVELLETLLAARLGRYQRYSKGYGCRALQYAINKKKAKMIEILIAKGIETNAIIHRNFGDRKESDSRKSNSWKSDSQELGFLWRRPTIVCGVSALGYAIQNDKTHNLWILQMLLNSGADPNSIVANSYVFKEFYKKRTALLEAISRNELAMAKKLINAGADANPGTRGDIFCTPLQMAAKKGSIDIVHLLLEHGADVNAPPHYRNGATALQYAAIGGYTGIALLLLQKGADVNAPPAQIDGRTALEGAAENGRLDMVRFLLNSGARIVGIGGEQYERALDFASRNAHDSIRRLLENYMNQTWESLVDWDPTSIGTGVLNGFQL